MYLVTSNTPEKEEITQNITRDNKALDSGRNYENRVRTLTGFTVRAYINRTAMFLCLSLRTAGNSSDHFQPSSNKRRSPFRSFKNKSSEVFLSLFVPWRPSLSKYVPTPTLRSHLPPAPLFAAPMIPSFP